MTANIMHIVLAGLPSRDCLVALLTITLLSLYYRHQFISHYPQFSRSYDLITLGFSLTSLAKTIFLPLDLNDAGFIHLEQSTENFLGTIGNLLLFIGLFPMIFGWAGIISSITRRYELVPVVEIEGEPEEMSPGVYITPSGSGPNLLSKLIKGRAPLIITRTMPKSVRKALNIKEVPVLWITAAECSEGCVNPRRLEYLLHTLVNFMRREETPKLIYLDGLEYLVIENGFIPVYKFLSALKDYALITNTVILVPAEKASFNEREWNLLRREFESLQEKAE
ncbi:hypothetical membrane protein, conserved [Thermococcus kodakarensis KOD1]|uniref:Hypothetical membrane protein, conserved n=1 Tax=Thermococcus kodakarensis (strain ATCC BAA-918 / JCM 12380 / KOD1) TaxID=69014 RepID=Q5JHP4_THEKO|nr:DUF835 domain-containing protein [Thermococcus kodakarensis]WCN28051.1 DUF835 domain-containing protein [Thermococcus kodakarensis]WCN30348.1 DUF835 domain-containing protein [Thermococcus kodakarensis]BAD86405.1 hypothetical membrane protein, conserved [Thermococcus kodakarensis KOD1]